jgi:acyl carrier protein
MSGTTDDSVHRVETLVMYVLASDSVDRDEALIESGLLDSFALIELLSAIEDEFAIQLPMEDLDLDLLRSVRSIASYVSNLRTE